MGFRDLQTYMVLKRASVVGSNIGSFRSLQTYMVLKQYLEKTYGCVGFRSLQTYMVLKPSNLKILRFSPNFYILTYAVSLYF